MPLRFRFAFTLTCSLAALALAVAAPTSAASYRETLAAADALAAEGSWEQAKLRYIEALAAAPDADARARCELLIEDTSWRSEATTALRWRDNDRWQRRHLAAYDRLEQPYREPTSPRPRDVFWVDLLTRRIAFERFLNLTDEPIGHFDAVAAHLGTQPPSPAAAHRFVAFLQRVLDSPAGPIRPFGGTPPFPRLRAYLTDAARIAADADDRAWCLWQLARLGDAPTTVVASANPTAAAAEIAARWSAALAASPHTRWAPLIRVDEFLWRVHSRYSPDLAANAPADLPAFLAELAAVRSALGREAPPELRNTLDQLERSLTEPRLDATANALFTPGTPIRFSYGTSGLARLVATLERTTPAGWLETPAPRFPGDRRAEAAAHPTGRTSVREWTIPLSGPARLAWNAAVVEAAPSLPSGLYILTLRGDQPAGSAPLVWQRKFTVSSVRGLGVFSSATTGRLFVYRADGQAVADTAVEFFATTPKPLTWSVNTDAQGSLPLRALDDQCPEVVALVAGEPVCFQNLATWHGPDHQLFFDVYTDRPLFRPGETAHWKLIARERHDGRFTVPQDLSGLKFRIRLGDDELVAPTPLVLSATGSTHGEIQIPAAAAAGEVSLQIVRGTDPNQPIEHAVSLFQVDRYVAPAATASVAFAGDARAFRPGCTLTARVTANYFSGGPLVGAPVRVTFRATDFTRNNANERFAKWSEALAREPRPAVTDAHGAAEAALTLPDFLPDGASLDVAAVVTPDGTPALTADAAVTISSSGLTLDPLGWTSPRLAASQESVSFAAVIRDGRGTPVALDVRAKLAEFRWSEVWLDAQGNPIPPDELAAALAKSGPRQPPRDGARLVHAGYTESIVAEAGVRTASDGRLAAAFTLPHAGLFRLRVFADDDDIAATAIQEYSRSAVFVSTRYDRHPEPADDSRRDQLSLVAFDDPLAALALNPETAALIAPVEVVPEQPLRVLAITPAGIAQAWLSLVGETCLSVEPLALAGRLALHRFATPPSLLGHANLNLLCRTEPGVPPTRAAVTIPVSKTPNQLRVALAPSIENSRPGQTVEVIARAADSAGQPAAGTELALRVADEAVASLLSHDDSEAPSNFLQLSATVSNREVWSNAETFDLHAPLDPRPGAIRNPAGVVDEDGELIVLSPFEISAPGTSYGYAASNTLAGGRLRFDPAVTVTTKQFLADTAAAAPTDVPIVLRRHFASTAFWSPEVITDAKGEARVTFTYPDNLTRWRVAAYAVGTDGNTFGTANAFTRTSLPFQARLQLPRFLIAGDTAEPSAVLVNRTDAPLHATASLALTGAATARDPAALTHADLTVPAQSETHTAWPISAGAPGETQLTLTARAGPEGDAMQLPLPILPDGIQQHTAAFARLAADAAQTSFSLELPATLDPARTVVSVQLSPNYATTLLDALPYLIDYPYGCVEQTMSRFLPAVVVRKTLLDLGLDAAAIERRILATESLSDQNRRTATAGLAHLDDVVRQSLARLDETHTYPGYGWWPGASSPDLWMTAYVSWGLSLAASAKVEIPNHLATRTTQSLLNLITAANTFDDSLAFAWAALARAPDADLLMRPGSGAPLFAKAFDAREKLSASGRACVALASKKFGTLAQFNTLVRNLDNGLERADAAGLGATVHWGAAHNYWRASEGAVESTALTLLALLELDHESPLIEPAANWLVLNRRSAHWSSTRDTSFAVLALNAYLQARGHLDAPGEVELLANQTTVQRVKFSRDSLLTAPSTLAIPPSALHGGTNTFTVRRLSGSNPVHTTALASSWAHGDDVKPAGHLVHVERRFERQKAEPTLIGALRLTSESLGPTGTAQTGEELTARVTLHVPNELEYVMIEVPKPAGCEPSNPLSGWDARLFRLDNSPAPAPASATSTTSTTSAASPSTASTTPSPSATSSPFRPSASPDPGRALYREEHDDRSAFFLDHMEAGTWELRFSLRAITPGDFRALPVTAEAMYVPEITANSDARRVKLVHTP